MSRLVARDGAAAMAVQLYRQAECDGELLAPSASASGKSGCRDYEFESLDMLDILPWMILQSAQEKAQEIIATATAEAVERSNQAVRQSAEAARAQATAELMPALAAFANASQALSDFEDQLFSRSTPALVALALEIAEKIIVKAVQADPEIVASVLERAKQAAQDAKQLRVWLNPADYQLLAELKPELIKVDGSAGRTIEVAASADIERGGCRLESESGYVDATIPTQLEEIRRQLLDTEL